MPVRALHHVTAVCTDAKRTLAFYRDELGFRLVKKTVNFDDPGSYHLYFGDDAGSPGTLMTFFEWPGASRGQLGRGSYETIAVVVPGTTEVRELEDPDGLRLELHPGDVPRLRHVTAYGDPEEWAPIVRGRAARARRAAASSGHRRGGHDPPHRVEDAGRRRAGG